MNYEKFKKRLKVITNNQESIRFYNSITKKIGKEKAHTLYEQYMNDTTIQDDEIKFIILAPYLEIRYRNTNNKPEYKNDIEDKENIDSVNFYLKEISKFPLLETEEEKNTCNRN